MSTALPPHIQHSSTRIPPSAALALLSTYLHNATTDASLHPNALLTENGPITPSTGSNMGLVLHNLKRLEAGLRGEYLAADLLFKKFGGEGLPRLMEDSADEVVGKGDAGVRREMGEENMDWQDLGEFEREQEVVQGGEVGARSNVLADEGVREQEKGTEKVQRVRAGRIDKEMRKKAKKERRLQEKRETEARRRKKKDAEL